MSGVDAIGRDLAELERDAAPLVRDAFTTRLSALEALEALEAGLEALAERGEDAAAGPLLRRARTRRARLARVDEALFARLREAIRRGVLRGAALRQELLRLAPPMAVSPLSCGVALGVDAHDDGGYDALDALVSGVFLDEPPPATARPELRGWNPEMVPYQPTPARVVLTLCERLRSDEVLCDLGSGLGQVCVLAHLLSGVRAVGIEIDPVLCAYAARLARRLDLSGLTFHAADARDADLPRGRGATFFLYTPFKGTLLDQVLGRLRELATDQPLRVASYGPCTPVVARQPWLFPEGEAHADPNRLALFRTEAHG